MTQRQVTFWTCKGDAYKRISIWYRIAQPFSTLQSNFLKRNWFVGFVVFVWCGDCGLIKVEKTLPCYAQLGYKWLLTKSHLVGARPTGHQTQAVWKYFPGLYFIRSKTAGKPVIFPTKRRHFATWNSSQRKAVFFNFICCLCVIATPRHSGNIRDHYHQYRV